jgi:translocation and assembly module TamA
VVSYQFDLGEEPIEVSITRLPYLYRFQAGGSRSVRGYGFESLSDSGLGANNLFTASVETEYNFHSDWSAAVFYDIGNAFNSWSDMNLKRGVGFGLRWYTVAGPIRVDYASALDLEGDPWRIHITIGTPLL